MGQFKIAIVTESPIFQVPLQIASGLHVIQNTSSEAVSGEKTGAVSLILTVLSLQMETKRVSFVALAVVTLVVFVASSIWYSPLLLGPQFLELSGATASAHPSPVKALFELLRTFVLAFVIAHLVLRLNVADWKQAVGLGLWLWVGFPVILLTGSILWQNVPWQLAAIHSGDWLIKLILIPVGIAVWPRRASA